MKSLRLSAAVIGLFLVQHLCGQSAALNLTAPLNYANQSKPAYITKDNTTSGDSITDAAATLGRVLFYDKRLSFDQTLSCSGCHQQAFGFSDPFFASQGVTGMTSRHTMRLINPRFATEVHFFWDQRANTLEDQTTQPIQNAIEMGFSGTGGQPSLSDLLNRLAGIPEYRVLFTSAFGSVSAIDQFHLQQALAQFVRSIQSFDSKYDAGRTVVSSDAPPFPNFTASENNGKHLFLTPPGPQGGAGCAGCHRPPEFDIDPNSRNNGVTAAIGGGTDLTNTRSPSLRDLVRSDGELNGPYMHNGAFDTLGQVIDHYNAIPADNSNLDPRLRTPTGGLQNLNLTQQQRNDIVAFLATLGGTNVYTDVRWSTPFDSNDQISLTVLDGVQLTGNGNGTATVTCKAARGMQYQFQYSVNLASWSTLATVGPDLQGMLRQTVSLANGAFYRFALAAP